MGALGGEDSAAGQRERPLRWHVVLERIRRHQSFARDIATLVTGKTTAFVVTLIATPIISRLFDPGDYGIGALFATLVTLAATLATLSWERAAILPKSEREAALLVVLAGWTLLGACALLWLAIATAAVAGLTLPYTDQLGAWLWFLPVALALLGAAQIAEGWLTRSRNYNAIAVSDGYQALFLSGSRVAGGAVFGSAVWVLIAGLLVGKLVKLGKLWHAMRVRSPLPHVRAEPGDMRHVMSEYRDFALYNSPTAFVKNLSLNLPVVLLGLMFAPAVVGFYAMASRLIRIPIKLAAAAVDRVYTQRIAHRHNAGAAMTPPFTTATVGLAAFALVPFGLLWVWGEDILAVFLGENWRTAGSYAAILVPWLYSNWIASPAGSVMVVLRRQGLALQIQMAVAALRATAFGVAFVAAFSPEQTLTAFVWVSVVSNVLVIVLAYFIARDHDRKLAASPAAADG